MKNPSERKTAIEIVDVKFGCIREHYTYVKVFPLCEFLAENETLEIPSGSQDPDKNLIFEIEPTDPFEDKAPDPPYNFGPKLKITLTGRSHGNLHLMSVLQVVNEEATNGTFTKRSCTFDVTAQVLKKTMGKPFIRSDVIELRKSEGLESDYETSW